MTAPGPVLFARYAYPPNALGYCGPDDAGELLERVDRGRGDRGLMVLDRQFDGAWPYLTLIAAAVGAHDPLSAPVVRAYWIGSPLLERVSPRLLATDVVDRFASRLGRHQPELGTAIAAAGRAHHNFHVFTVYPWVGQLRAGWVEEPLRVLDGCRIRWGTVESVSGDTALVRQRPLVWHAGRLALGAPHVAAVRVGRRGYRLVPGIRPGRSVAMHWNWVCDVLRPVDLAALRHYTCTQLRLANSGGE
ncbi:hypothetical protein Athai_08840 [Actinocatenispora thailandica]|uniref:Uncharacterized protein n=1 Tax=Actinocatenispora thailandica TaxID=227318 RepID=A0A7R7HVB3_9ACTN|nr:DUF6390 family protein [Actinocatenispora thailandica]BCJ33381.1 hypothetical protein Athai_08840 [Actinocatenispora thailandica]